MHPLNSYVYFSNDNKSISEFTHGDKLCLFIENCYKDYTILYYNAECNGKISSEGILNGLNYMKSNGIKNINISLSSKQYSTEIETWIKNNPNITVYASYNNAVNTYDYPAMYENVIGSTGIKNYLSLKECDITYNSLYIFNFKNFQMYKENSYLSLITMFEKNISTNQ